MGVACKLNIYRLLGIGGNMKHKLFYVIENRGDHSVLTLYESEELKELCKKYPPRCWNKVETGTVEIEYDSPPIRWHGFQTITSLLSRIRHFLLKLPPRRVEEETAFRRELVELANSTPPEGVLHSEKGVK